MDGLNILVADDSEMILAKFVEFFKDTVHKLKTASGAIYALEMVKNEKFDIVFTDMNMPEANGARLCKEIKKISPKTVVLLISGDAQETVRHQVEFMDSGGREEYLRKPLLKEEIIAITEKIAKELKDKNSERK